MAHVFNRHEKFMLFLFLFSLSLLSLGNALETTILPNHMDNEQTFPVLPISYRRQSRKQKKGELEVDNDKSMEVEENAEPEAEVVPALKRKPSKQKSKKEPKKPRIDKQKS